METSDNLTIKFIDKKFIVTYKHLNIVGVGKTIEEAKTDFKYEVDKFFEFFTLRKHREQLNKHEKLYSL